VAILAEPGGSYSRDLPFTEEEVAIRLLKGQMEEVAPEHDFEKSSEEYVANAVACAGEEVDLERINTLMVGSMEPVLPELVAHKLVERKGTKLVLSPLAKVMAEHFIGMERLIEVIRLTEVMDDPVEIIAELESEDLQHEKTRPEQSRKLGTAQGKRERKREHHPEHGGRRKR
jgi:helicase